MLSAVVAALMAASTIASPVSTNGWNSPPPPDRFVIDIVNVLGSGCPKDTSAVAVSDDNSAFTLTYSTYTALVGVGAGLTWARALLRFGAGDAR